MPLKLSIALCTYNGSQYILDQLNSIANQSRLPDEVIICDDKSKDNTIEIIHDFLSTAKFNIKIYENESNLGSTKNFEKAITLCTGDIIFLCDQDDIWKPNKLELVEQLFTNCPLVGLVFTDAELIDSKANLINQKLWKSIGFYGNEKAKIRNGNYFNVLIKRNVVTGATMAFRSSFKKDIIPIPECSVHDSWITLIIAAKSQLAMIDTPLIKYRIHNGQQIGSPISIFEYAISKILRVNQNPYKYNIVPLENRKKYYNEALLRVNKIESDSKIKFLIINKLRHIDNRLGLFHSNIPKKICIFIIEILSCRYHNYSFGFYTIIIDLISILKYKAR